MKVRKVFQQALALLLKNVKSFRPFSILVMVLSPILMLWFASLIITSIDDDRKTTPISGEAKLGLSNFLDRSIAGTRPLDIFFSPKSDERVQKIMETFMKNEVGNRGNVKLHMEIDRVHAFQAGLLRAADVGSELNVLYVDFNITSDKISIKTAKGKYEYSGYNVDDLETNFVASIYSSIMAVKSSGSENFNGISLTVNRKEIVHPRSSYGRYSETYDTFTKSMIVVLFLIFGSFPMFFYPLFLIVEEKRSNLINLMRQMNVMESLYWVALFLVMGLVSLFSSLLSSLFLSYESTFDSLYEISFGSLWLFIFMANLQLTGLAQVPFYLLM